MLKWGNFVEVPFVIYQDQTASHNPQYPAMLHVLFLQLNESIPHSSWFLQRWSCRTSGTWQALSAEGPIFPSTLSEDDGHTCLDRALARLTWLSFCDAPLRVSHQLATRGKQYMMRFFLKKSEPKIISKKDTHTNCQSRKQLNILLYINNIFLK